PTGVHLGVGPLIHPYGWMASSRPVGHFAGACVLQPCLRVGFAPFDPPGECIAFDAHAAPPSTSASGTSGLRTARPPSSSMTALSASCSAEVSGPQVNSRDGATYWWYEFPLTPGVCAVAGRLH